MKRGEEIERNGGEDEEEKEEKRKEEKRQWLTLSILSPVMMIVVLPYTDARRGEREVIKGVES